ncbi:MAG TPA: glycosyltransferase family 39 protein [Terriglobia bacterium]|nr:glycosyltransferase family 39 protein [Terriglobia bacterium]
MRRLLLLLLVAGCIFFAGLGRLPLTEPDEGRNAEVAREMLALHDGITPHFDGLTYLDKPVVFFWLVAGSFRVFGPSEWAARLPSALAALGTMMMVWLLGRSMYGERAGLIAALVFATSPMVMAFSRLVIFDMTLTFLVTAAMMAFWLAHAAEPRRRWLEYLVFLAAGTATLTKGPVGLLLPLLSIVVYAAIQRKFARLKGLAWGRGLLLFLALTSPWFIVVSLRHPDFPRYAFWDESVLRFATGHARRGGSVFYYLPVFLIGFLPWSFPLLFAGLNRIKRWRRLGSADHAAAAFLLAWALTVFVFFSISHSKLAAYVLPAFPALAVLMGKLWSAEVSPEPGRRRPDWLTAGFAVLIALGLLLATAAAWMQAPWLHRAVAAKLSPEVLETLPASLFYSGLILAALGILGRNLAARARGRVYTAGSLAVFALAMPLLAVRWWEPLKIYATTSSLRNLAEAIQRGPQRDLPVYGYYYFRTSLPFYLRRPVGLVTSDGGQLTSNYIAAHWPELARQQWAGAASARGAAPLFVNGSEFATLERTTSTPFLVLVRNTEVPDVEKFAPELEPLWSSGPYSVWEVSPGGPRHGTARAAAAEAILEGAGAGERRSRPTVQVPPSPPRF